MPGWAKVPGAVGVALVVLCAACTSTGHRGSSEQAQAAAHPGTAITVGSFDFPESVLLGYLYADALAAKGFPVRVLPNLGNRELVDPALMNGLIQLVPEYSGSALEFMSLGRQPATSDAAATYRALARAAQRRGLVATEPASAQDGNAIVVTAATAARYHLRTIADLGGLAQRFVFGGPPECQERAYCLPGLKQTYGLRFKAFTATDAGGPVTLQALEAGQISVGLLFTTDPAVRAQHLVILEDNGALQPAENVTPLIRRDTVARYGSRLTAVLNAVSARLSTTVLRLLNARAERPGSGPRRAADAWLRAQGLLARGQGAR